MSSQALPATTTPLLSAPGTKHTGATDLGPLNWEHGVLAYGSPAKSLKLVFISKSDLF